MKKRTLITAVTGQDRACLTEFLPHKVHEVYGIKRRVLLFNSSRIDYLYQDPLVFPNKDKAYFSNTPKGKCFPLRGFTFKLSADVLLVATEWKEFRGLSFDAIKNATLKGRPCAA